MRPSVKFTFEKSEIISENEKKVQDLKNIDVKY